MKAIVQRGYGDPRKVLRLAEVDQPKLEDDQVLVRVKAASINAGDWRQVRADPLLIRFVLGVRSPRNPGFGADVSGVVETVGRNVTHLRAGDEVYGMRQQAAIAELVTGSTFARKPANLSFEEAAAVPAAGCTALQAVRDHGKVGRGQTVLVNGAGGGVGHFAVQIAKAFGADVTGATSTDKMDMVAGLGADRVIDYTLQPFTRSGRKYDVVVDCAGDQSLGAALRALAPGGRLVVVGSHRRVLNRLILGQFRARVLRQPVIFFIASGGFEENLATLRELAEGGKLRPVIERTYPIEKTPEAVAYAAKQQTLGKVVIVVTDR